MAKLMLVGRIADVELVPDDEDEQVIHAACRSHSLSADDHDGLMPCSWTKDYDTLVDATQFAADHADRGSV